jgi:dTDP-D-glucose 4,6-dehydratase
LAKLIKQIISYDGDLTYDLKMPDGNPRKLIDSSKIRSLGWKPKTNLEKGIELSYESFLKNIN